LLGFVELGKLENPEKNPRSKVKNQQQTQPTYDTGPGNRTLTTLMGDECSYHCTIPAPYFNRELEQKIIVINFVEVL